MTGTADSRGLVGLLAAVATSKLGTRMSFLALPWFVLATTGSAIETGLVSFAETAAYAAVQAGCGPVVDRLGARRVSVATDAAAALLVGLIPLLAAVHGLSLTVLAGLVAVAGGARGAGDSAREVIVPGVGAMAQTPIERTSGLYDGASRMASLIGAPLAGVLIGVVSATGVLAIDAVTFAVSAMTVLSFVPAAAEPPRQPPAATSYRRALTTGLRFLAADRLLVALAAMVMVTNFIDQAAGAVLLPVWASRVARSPVALGLIGGALGLGATAGNTVTVWLARRLPRRWTFATGYAIAGAPRLVALGLATSVAPVLPVFFLGGVGAGAVNPMSGATMYDRVPRDLQARVLGAISAITWAGIPVGSLAAGGAVAAWGVRTSLLLAATLYGLTTLAPFVFRVWREMDLAG